MGSLSADLFSCPEIIELLDVLNWRRTKGRKKIKTSVVLGGKLLIRFVPFYAGKAQTRIHSRDAKTKATADIFHEITDLNTKWKEIHRKYQKSFFLCFQKIHEALYAIVIYKMLTNNTFNRNSAENVWAMAFFYFLDKLVQKLVRKEFRVSDVNEIQKSNLGFSISN